MSDTSEEDTQDGITGEIWAIPLTVYVRVKDPVELRAQHLNTPTPDDSIPVDSGIEGAIMREIMMNGQVLPEELGTLPVIRIQIGDPRITDEPR